MKSAGKMKDKNIVLLKSYVISIHITFYNSNLKKGNFEWI